MPEPDLLSIYYTVASIIVIYQMFLLQAWTNRVDASRESLEKAGALAPNDMPRKEAKKTAKRLMAEFPLVSSTLILVVIFVLMGLAVSVALGSTQGPVFTMTPALALAGVSLFSLLYSYWKWGGFVRAKAGSL